MAQINANWFPGHMKKALNNVKEIISKCDGIIEIGDARLPYSSFPTNLDSLTKNKQKIFIFSKIDLADNKKLDTHIRKLQENNIKSFCFDLRDKKNAQVLTTYLQNIRTNKAEKYKSLNFPTPSKYFIILGVPNVGKSTLINLLSNKKKASVENKPGKTRDEPLIKVADKLYIYDTPGILEPNYQDKEIMLKLALINCVKDSIFPLEHLGNYFFELINKLYPNMLQSYYSIDSTDYYTFFYLLAENKKMYKANNILDTDRAIRFALNDFKLGKLGKVCLDE